jgi:hypothetical protein
VFANKKQVLWLMIHEISFANATLSFLSIEAIGNYVIYYELG